MPHVHLKLSRADLHPAAGEGGEVRACSWLPTSYPEEQQNPSRNLHLTTTPSRLARPPASGGARRHTPPRPSLEVPGCAGRAEPGRGACREL